MSDEPTEPDTSEKPTADNLSNAELLALLKGSDATPVQPNPNGEEAGMMGSPEEPPPLTEYDLSYINNHNAINHNFFTQGREYTALRFKLQEDLRQRYQSGAKLPDYNQQSLYQFLV